MAASRGKRRKPENSEGEQPEQRDRFGLPVRPENIISDSVSTEHSSGGVIGEPLRRKRLRNLVQQQPSDYRPQGKRNLGIPQEPTRLHLRKLGAEQPSATGRRSRQHRGQKQLLGQEETRLASQPPLGSRPKAVPIKQVTPQQTVPPPVLRIHPQRRRLQPDVEISQQRLSSRTEPGQLLSQNQDYKNQELGYTREENQPISSPKLRRLNPWEVNPKANIPPSQPPAFRQDANLKSNPFLARGNQNSISNAANPGPKRRSLYEVQVSQPFQPHSDTRNRRRNINQLRSKETLSSAPTQPGTTRAKRVKPSAGYQSFLSQTTQPRHPQKRPVGPLVYIIRLLILGIGIGALAGTLLSALNPATQASVKHQDTAKKQVPASPTPANPSPSLQLTPEISGLKAQIQPLAKPYSTLTPGVFVLDLDTGAYMDLDGRTSFASASTIKLPILIAFFQDVDAGKVRLDEQLTLKAGTIAGGSGDLQYKQAGTKYTALEVATKMIVISDNTATNMLIERLGGAQALNQRFRSWGLTTTAIRNRLPDIEGTNTTSPKELANLMSVVQRGDLVSSQSRDRLLNIMQRNEINTLLPQGLGSGASIAHKTGNIGSLLADVGLVEMPTGKRYVIAVMVKRPFNDASAEELIRQISRKTYDYFNQPRTTPSTNSMPLKSVRSIT